MVDVSATVRSWAKGLLLRRMAAGASRYAGKYQLTKVATMITTCTAVKISASSSGKEMTSPAPELS